METARETTLEVNKKAPKSSLFCLQHMQYEAKTYQIGLSSKRAQKVYS